MKLKHELVILIKKLWGKMENGASTFNKWKNVFVRQERSFLFAWVFEIPTRYQSETKTETILGEKK